MNKPSTFFERLNNEIAQHCKIGIADANPSKKLESVKINVTSILATYFSVGYYAGIVPFKPVYHPDKRSYQLKRGKYQQIVCAAFWIIIWSVISTNGLRTFVVDGLQTKKTFTAKSYFTLFNDIEHDIAILMYFLIVMKNQQKLEDCVNQAMDLQFITAKVFQCAKFYVYFMYATIGGFSMLLIPFISNYYVDQLKNPKESFQQYVGNGRSRFFLEKNFESYTFGNVLLGVLEFVGFICWSQINWVFSCLFVGPLPIVIWLAVRNFELYAKDIIYSSEIKSETKLQEINEKYENLKRFCFSVNNILSVVTLMWILETVVRAVMIMNQLVSSRSILNILTAVIWIISIAVAVILSGESYRKMECFKTQLLDENNYKMFHKQDKLTLKRLLKELDGGPVGIGATGMYKLDYGFIAQLMTAVVTIFLVSFEKD